MLKLITHDNSVIPLKCDDYCIKELASGLDELLFSISIFDPVYPQIQEECRVLADEGQYFLVKAIDGGGSTASIKCVLDLDEWKEVINLNYTTAERLSTARPKIRATIAATGRWVDDNDAWSIAIPVTPGRRYRLQWRMGDVKIVGDVFRFGQADTTTTDQALSGVLRSTPQDTPTATMTATKNYIIVEIDAEIAERSPTVWGLLTCTFVGNRPPEEIVEGVLPDGWAMTDDSGIDDTAIIELSGATPMDVLEACREAFDGLTYRFDNDTRTVTLVNMYDGENLGAFVTRDLNLKKNDYKGKSTTFATRLYAVGKDGLTFSGINGDVPYIDNKTFANKTVCAYMQDDRYETPAALLTAASDLLKTISVPSRSYTCDVVDLAAAAPEKYGFLDFPLFSVCALIDDTRAMTKVNHVVMERWRYPNLPTKNKVVLSTVAPRIQSQVSNIQKSMTNTNSEYQQQQRATFEVLSAIFSGAHGGSVRLMDTDGDGEPDELYIADSTDPATATRVWRFNYLGWAASTNGYAGPFVMGASFDNGGTIYANTLRVNGAYTVQQDDGTVAGYMGRGKGSDGVSDTYGVMLCGPGGNPESATASTNYIIVTNAGTRMQAGGNSLWATGSGAYYNNSEIATQTDIASLQAQINDIWDYITDDGGSAGE